MMVQCKLSCSGASSGSNASPVSPLCSYAQLDECTIFSKLATLPCSHRLALVSNARTAKHLIHELLGRMAMHSFCCITTR